MDGFWILRCLKKHIDLPDKIGLFLSRATTKHGSHLGAMAAILDFLNVHISAV